MNYADAVTVRERVVLKLPASLLRLVAVYGDACVTVERKSILDALDNGTSVDDIVRELKKGIR
jgi:hypothetical protein